MPRNDLTPEQRAAMERAAEEPRSGDVDDLRTLGSLLAHSEPVIRKRGLVAMNAILDEAPSLELDASAESLLSLLADALDDDLVKVRTAAAVVTARLATVAPAQASAAVGLIRELFDAELARVRHGAIRGLSVLAADAPDTAAVTAIEALVDRIDVEPERAGTVPAKGLVTVAQAAPERRSVVARALEPTPSRGWTESTRTDCLGALGTLGTIDAAAAREARRRLRPALADESSAVRRAAVDALGTSATAAPEHAPPALRTLRLVLLDEATDVRTEAVAALGEIAATDAAGATTALATLGTALESNPADEVRRTAAATLATIEVPGPDDLDVERSISRSPSPPAPTIGAVADDRLADAGIVGALSAVLTDHHHDVRTYAAEGLTGVAAAAPEQAVPAVGALGDSLASEVRDGDPPEPPAVGDPVNPEQPLAAAAASALRRVAAEHPRAVAPAVDALVAALDADDAVTVIDAARAIERLGEAAPGQVGPAIEPLARLAEQPPSESVEEATRETLTTIGNAEPAPGATRSSVPAAARERLGVPRQVWRTPVRRPVPGGLAVTGGRACVATDGGDLLGVDADSGESEWRRELDPTEPSAVTAAAGPFLVGCRDGRVVAVAPESGTTRWVFDPDDRAAPDTRLAAAGGTVAVWNGAGVLYGIDAAGGTVRWRSAFDHDGKAFPTVADDTVYLGTGGGRLVAVDAASGAEEWRHDLGEPVGSPPAYAGGTVSLGTVAGTVVALAGDDGTSRWRTEFDDAVDVSPAVADGAVYVGCGAAGLHALDAATGEPRWRVQPGGRVVSQPAVGTTGVYVGTDEGVYAVGAEDGERRWSLGTDGTAVVGLTVSDGPVYAATWDGSLYALAEAGGERRSASASR
ncbi:PQQ-binding-like beta-propeller repeat protein [Haloplanus halophilus]|uniref:outer membrane protein assembly factor BamB family protein n=1 Tax=Haloplanus halophilus TaxID=2949993 RepID=UPI00204118DA|nr:PQQ-binding-like beta-propeller repeat protein [Haloplanus sp. GDY1]